MCIDELIGEWERKVHPGLRINLSVYVNNMLFADDQVLIQESEDNMQQAEYQLRTLCYEYSHKISTSKNKVMANKG